nr:1,4-dihydroxy-6-naphthoate synthase [uncultured Rikenella sp.]
MTMRLHISPCPNDTFIFHALIHGLVDTEGLVFDVRFDDIEALNRAAIERDGEEDVIKISYAALPEVAGAFRLLDSGSALGHGNGPLLVSRRAIGTEEWREARVGIPGERTTANRLLSLLFPEAIHKRAMLFSEIAPAVAAGELEAGVLIHEGRFTYAAQGLQLVADLGELWERRTGLPIPLGGIVLHRRHGAEMAERVARVIRRSIEYAQAHPEASAEFVRTHAQELEAEVRQKHISYFVNDYSLSLGATGLAAVMRLTGLDGSALH